VVLVSHRGAVPRIHPDAYVAPTAVVSGAVTIGAGVRILHNAVVTAEDGEVIIGRDVVVMEHALVRGRASHPCRVGDSVMIGPNAHVNGAVVHDHAFIATGAAIFPGAVVGEGAEVRIHAVVQVNTTLAPGAVVPIGWVAVGSPAQLFPPDRHDDIWAVQRTLDFAGTVYGAGRESTMAEIMRGQSEFYGAHRDDEVTPE
jgi:carbonic anhydrase/acetyltransferase-like protein (isoleucine patch superfamily)